VDRDKFWNIIAAGRLRYREVIREIATKWVEKDNPDLTPGTPEFELILEPVYHDAVLFMVGILEQLIAEDLQNLLPQEIIEFDHLFEKVLDESFTYDLYAACAILDYNIATLCRGMSRRTGLSISGRG
jgi:hypothetical protein